jgi:hypothetical protein
MQLKVQLVVCADDGREEQVQEVATLDKECQRLEHLGLVDGNQLCSWYAHHEHNHGTYRIMVSSALRSA